MALFVAPGGSGLSAWVGGGNEINSRYSKGFGKEASFFVLCQRLCETHPVSLCLLALSGGKFVLRAARRIFFSIVLAWPLEQRRSIPGAARTLNGKRTARGLFPLAAAAESFEEAQ